MTTTDYISVEALISYIENKQAEYKIEFDRAIKYFTLNSEYYEGMIDSLGELEKNIEYAKLFTSWIFTQITLSFFGIINVLKFV